MYNYLANIEYIKLNMPKIDTIFMFVVVFREIALEVLAQQEIGSFIVRDSTTHPNCYALSVKVPKFENPTGISHYLIHRTQRSGFKLKVCHINRIYDLSVFKILYYTQKHVTTNHYYLNSQLHLLLNTR